MWSYRGVILQRSAGGAIQKSWTRRSVSITPSPALPVATLFDIGSHNNNNNNSSSTGYRYLSSDTGGGRGGGGRGGGGGGGGGGQGGTRGGDRRGNWPQQGRGGRGGKSGGGGGGGGGRGRGRGGGDWNRNNNYNNNNNSDGRNIRGNTTKKPNFSDQFLEPAARGELKKHQSGIPKLANRKPKGHSVRGADPLLMNEVDELMGLDGMMMEDEPIMAMDTERTSGTARGQQAKKTGTIDQGSKLEDLNPQEYEEVVNFLQIYQAFDKTPDKEDYYWNEIDYENAAIAKKHELFDKLMAEATRDADGNLVVEVDEETFDMFGPSDEAATIDSEVRDGASQNNALPQKRRPGGDDLGVEFVMETMGIKGSEKPPNPKEYDVVQPLQLSGPTMNDFVRSMMEHPTKFGQLRFVARHPESTREPVPDLPPYRRNPPPEFVEANARFIYVWGLPPLIIDGKPCDLNNPLHSMEIQKTVASLFDVQPEAVYAASLSSAFVGFPSRVDQRFALEFGPVRKVFESAVSISKYVPQEEDQIPFNDDEMESVVLLENLPSGMTPSSLASSLFPAESDVGSMVYGDLKPEDFVMLSGHSAVLRFESAEMADAAVVSAIVKERLREFGQHRVRYNKARRALVFTGKHTGPLGTDLERKLGHQLIVDGDMPTKDFFLSHASTIHLRNLDPSMTKQEISDFFQPCCAIPRDVEGSVQIVKCQEGLPTGKAYVGFDEHGEAEAAMALCETNGRLTGLGANNVIMKRVKDAIKVTREKRPTREEGDLLDSLDNWEQYVDPQDIQELVDSGISKYALDEALRAIRYHNPTFASLDQALRTETLDPDKEAGGMYRELVQTYISTLKECISTPENPGPIYESLFFRDEEIDTEIFEKEPIRQEELRKRREIP